MEQTDNAVDYHKLILRNVQPEVKAFDELSPNLLPGIRSDVSVWLKQFLGR